MMKLSFIVPVYNVAPYLRKCVDSLLAQDYDDYEILLVDDGSTDDSWQICDELAKRPLIRVIHQGNAGLSAARNTGILAARGEYLCFVDSDDYWGPNVLGRLMAQVEQENLDVLRYDHQNVRLVKSEGVKKSFEQERDKNELTSEWKYEVFEPNKTPRNIDRGNEIVDGETYLNTRMSYACYAWQFILRREIILNLKSAIINHNSEIDGSLFTPGIHFEDVDWLPRMMLRAKRVNSSQTIVYNYLVRQGSITKTQGNKERIRKNLEDRMKIIEKYSEYIDQNPSCKWLKNMQSSMVVGVLTTIACELYQERKDYIARLKKLNVFPLSIADQGRTYSRRAKIINIWGYSIYCMIMHNIR